MNKRVILFTPLLCCLSLVAQHTIAQSYLGAQIPNDTISAVQLGDVLLIDSMPCLVIYVDSTGQHGLVMSPCCNDNSTVIGAHPHFRYIKGMNLEKANRMVPLYIPASIVNERERKKNIAALIADNSIYGQENAKLIREYCQRNNLDMAVYFPEQHRATLLGEGWFIPGAYELELYAKFIMNGRPMGREGGLPQDEFYARAQELTTLSREIGDTYGLSSYENGHFQEHMGYVIPVFMLSSTLNKGVWAQQHKDMIKTDPFFFLGIITFIEACETYHNDKEYGYLCLEIEKLKKEGQINYTFFYKNRLYYNYYDYATVAFKEF